MSSSPAKSSLLQTLQRHWGYDAFRSLQEEAISRVLSGKDSVVLFPTGGGKSLVYQLPVLHQGSKALVVSPLIALMEDQVREFAKAGGKAVTVHSNLSREDRTRLLDAFKFGDAQLLFVSPERLASDNFRLFIQDMHLSYVAVDEAHCISQWGHDFRPAYLKIGEFLEFMHGLPVLALTATATPKVSKDIVSRLGMRNPKVLAQSFERSNLVVEVLEPENKYVQLLRDLKKVDGSKGAAIVYSRSRPNVEELQSYVSSHGLTCEKYHAGMSRDDRSEAQQRWTNGQSSIMIATNAFGMGINKDDVRLVIHYDLPNSIEEYYQEIGRAGRDGATSLCKLYVYPSDPTDRWEYLKSLAPNVSVLTDIYLFLVNHNAIPAGQISDDLYKIDIHALQSRLSLTEERLRSLLKVLEDQGFISIQEYEGPSYFRVLLRKQYARLKLPKDEQEVMECLLRGDQLTAGYYREIKHDYLKVRLGMDHDDQLDLFLKWQDEALLRFQEIESGLYVRIEGPRMTRQALGFNLNKIKVNHKRKLDLFRSLVAYLRSTSCRMSELTGYFGEKISDCGKCDRCRDGQGRYKVLKDKIGLVIKDEAKTLDTLLRSLDGAYTEAKILDALRRLYRDGYITYSEDEKFLWIKH